MRIAIIGYGSLIWDLDNLAPFIAGDWQIGSGPEMPVEFSRISPKRQQALVLVIDQQLQHRCQTSVIESARDCLDQAVHDLAARERCAPAMIGIAEKHKPVPSSLPTVQPWLQQSNYDAVIWTALPGNFHDETGRAFSHAAAAGYLQGLRGAALEEAWRYIEFAPAVTDTPFRGYLGRQSFWQAMCAERETAT